jgi:hypothetical protein
VRSDRTWRIVIVTVPSSAQVGKPEEAPAPMAAATAVSGGPVTLLPPPPKRPAIPVLPAPPVPPAEETAEELSLLAWLLDVVFDSYTARGALVGRRGSSSTHERTHHNRGVDFAVALSAAKGTGLAASDLAVSDDGSVRLGATSARSLLVRSLRAN